MPKLGEIEFRYSHCVPADELDQLGEQELWDGAARVAERFRIKLVQFWSTATPHRRAEAKRNVAVLGAGGTRGER